MTNNSKPNSKNKNISNAERKAAGLPAVKKLTPLPSTVAKADRSNMQVIADELARNFQGVVLRYRVTDDNILVVLFKDGRKHYLKLEQ